MTVTWCSPVTVDMYIPSCRDDAERSARYDLSVGRRGGKQPGQCDRVSRGGTERGVVEDAPPLGAHALVQQPRHERRETRRLVIRIVHAGRAVQSEVDQLV